VITLEYHQWDHPLIMIATIACRLTRGRFALAWRLLALMQDFGDALSSSPVADMVNRSGAMGLWSHIGGYFIYAQVQDVPGVRWAHFDLGDPVYVTLRTVICLLDQSLLGVHAKLKMWPLLHSSPPHRTARHCCPTYL
jgi:hypothetical protein